MTTFNKFKLDLRTVLYIVIAVSVVLAGARIYMIEAFYENEMYTFAHGTVLPDIFNYFIFGAVIIVFILFALMDKSCFAEEMGNASASTVVFAAATGFFALVGGLYAISQITIKDPVTEMMQQMGAVDVYAQRLNTFVKIQCVLSLAVFAYFMLTAFSVNKYSRAKSVLGILSILWHVVFLLVIYFDMSKPINSPIKVMLQFAVLVSMIYMVYEMRFMLGMGKPRMFVATSLVSVIVIAAGALPMTVCAFTGAFNVMLSNLLYSVQLVGMLGYIISRLITYLKQPKKIN